MKLSEPDWVYVQERAADFTGRGWVFARLDRFLHGPPGAFLLLGEPGTGKTAIAAQLALAAAGRLTPAAAVAAPHRTVPIAAAYFCRAGQVDLLDIAQRLSDQLADAVPRFADARQATLLPGIHVRNVHVHTGPIAAGGSATGVHIDLSRLGAKTAFMRAVTLPLKRVREAGEMARIVLLVDALDESLDPTTTETLPQMLGAIEDAHLLVTTRPDHRAIGGLRERAEHVGLLTDAPPGSDDVLEYVQRRLTSEGTPAAMTVLAQRIAEQASGNFLYALYVIDALRGARMLAALDDAAARRVPLPAGGLRGIYQEFLRRELWRNDRAWSTRLGPVLAPLAVAQDEGLTTEQLRLIAGQLGVEPMTRTAIREVTRTARQFLDGPAPDGPFRVYHKSFADFLVDPEQNSDFLIDSAETHEAIVAAYAATDPLSWDRYARRNLALHASEAGQLDRLLEDVRFLLAADPARLVPLLPARPEPPVAGIVAVLRMAGSAAAGLSPVPRARQLALAAAHLGLADLRSELAARVDDGWVPLWAHRLVPYQSLAGHAGPVRAVALGQLGDQDVIVSGGDDGTVRVWGVSGAPRQSLTGHAGPVRAVAIGRAGDQDVIVTGGDDGAVRVWDAVGRPAMRPLAGHAGPVRAVAIGRAGEQDVIVAGGDDGLRVWNGSTGQVLEPPPYPLSPPLSWLSDARLVHERGITDVSGVKALAIGEADGRGVIVSVSDTCDVWDPTRQELIRRLGPRYAGPLTAVATGKVRGRDVIVSASSDGEVQLWNLASGAAERVDVELGALKAVAVGQFAGRQVVVAGGADGVIWSWDVTAQVPVGGPLSRQASTVNAIAVGRVANREVIVSGGRDGTVRIWDAAPLEHDGTQLPGHISRVETLAAGALGGRDVIVSGGDDGFRKWDATTGHAVGGDVQPDRYRQGFGVKAVAIVGSGRWNGNSLIVASHKGQISRGYEEASCWPVRTPIPVPGAKEPGDAEAIVTSGHDGVWAWNAGAPHRIFSGAVYVTPVAAGQIGDRDVLVSGHENGTLRIWDLGLMPVAYLAAHGARITAVAIGKIGDRDVIVAGRADGSVRVWDAVAKQPTGDPLAGHLRPVTAVAAGRTSGRDVIVSGSTDGKIRIWDVATGRLETLEMLDSVTGLAVASNHLAVASGTAVAVFTVPNTAPAATIV